MLWRMVVYQGILKNARSIQEQLATKDRPAKCLGVEGKLQGYVQEDVRA